MGGGDDLVQFAYCKGATEYAMKLEACERERDYIKRDCASGNEALEKVIEERGLLKERLKSCEAEYIEFKKPLIALRK